jgi:transcriptional regulator with XRE-family HTH domain
MIGLYTILQAYMVVIQYSSKQADTMEDDERQEPFPHPLREARKARGWTQSNVAEKLGVANLTVARWEKGMTLPHAEQRKALCELFDKSASELGLTSEHTETLTAQSYFTPNLPLIDMRDYSGRKSERRALLQRIRKHGYVSIVGERRIGKTWLLTYLKLVAAQELGAQFQVAYLDANLPLCSTVVGFTQEVITQLKGSPPDTSNGLVDLQLLIRDFAAQHIVPVLCIDEFEALTRSKKRTEFSPDFYHQLRALGQTLPLVLVVTSRIPLYKLFNREQWRREGFDLDYDTSTFYNVFEQITLSPFTSEEAEQFIREKSRAVRFTSEETQYFREFGQDRQKRWLPSLLQSTGNKLLIDRERQRIKDQSYRQEFQRWFDELCRNLFPGEE